jgi:collagenase-like PrtC family protease
VELLVNPTSYTNALKLIEMSVHQLYVGEKQFSTRNSCDFNLEQIKNLVENKKNTKILVLINKLFFEPEIEELEKYIIELSKFNIDGIIFADYAVNQIVYEQKLNIKLIYNPDTLVVNYGQFEFYKQNNISEVSLARELNAKQTLEIIKNKKDMYVQMQVCGYMFMMHSR